MPVISAIRRRINEFRKTGNYENVLYFTKNLNIQSMLRGETSFHPKDGREIGTEAVFAGQVSQWPVSRAQPTESAMTCSGSTALRGEILGKLKVR